MENEYEGEDKLIDSFRKFDNQLLDIDFKSEFERLGLELHVKNAEAYSYRIYASIGKENLSYIDTGKLTYKDPIRSWVGITKPNMEEMLEYNKSSMPKDVRFKLYNMLEGFKHLMDNTDEMFQELERRKYQLEKIKDKNLTEKLELSKNYADGDLTGVIYSLGAMTSNMYTGSEMNAKYETQVFDSKKDYMTIMLGGGSELVLHRDEEAASGYFGKIITSRKGYSASVPLAEISKLDKDELSSVMSKIYVENKDQLIRLQKVRGLITEEKKDVVQPTRNRMLTT
ncbi:hypothetical protein [Pseudomonas extremaustralis]